MTLQSVTKDEIVDRLSFSPSRSLESSPKPTKLPFVKGQEYELLAALKGMPSMQVAVAFQYLSHALAPEAGALLSDLGQALASAKLANSRVMIGVHTNSVGSDEYNVDLSGLRAKAIVEILASVHGFLRDRLVPFGFGRTRDSTLPDAAADERIQVVNLGPVVQKFHSKLARDSRADSCRKTRRDRACSPDGHPIPAGPTYVHSTRPPPAYGYYDRPPPAYGYYRRPPPAYLRYATAPPNFHGSLTTRPKSTPIVTPPPHHLQQVHKRTWPQWADSPPPEPGATRATTPMLAHRPAPLTVRYPPRPNDGGFGNAPGGPGQHGRRQHGRRQHG